MTISKPRLLLKRLQGLRSYVGYLPHRIKEINEEITECEPKMTSQHILDICDTLDECIVGFETITAQYCNILKTAKQRLEEKASSYIEQQKNDIRRLGLARLQEHIPEELDTDRRYVEDPRYIEHPRQKPRR